MELDLTSVAFGAWLSVLVFVPSLAFQRHGLPAPLQFWKTAPILEPLITAEKLNPTATTIVCHLPSPKKTTASSELIHSGAPDVLAWILLFIVVMLLAMACFLWWVGQSAHPSHPPHDGNAGLADESASEHVLLPKDLPHKHDPPLRHDFPFSTDLPLPEDTPPAEDTPPTEDTPPAEDTSPAEDTHPTEDAPPTEDTLRPETPSLPEEFSLTEELSPSEKLHLLDNSPFLNNSSLSEVPMPETFPFREEDDETEDEWYDPNNRFASISPASVKKTVSKHAKKAEKAFKSTSKDTTMGNATAAPVGSSTATTSRPTISRWAIPNRAPVTFPAKAPQTPTTTPSNSWTTTSGFKYKNPSKLRRDAARLAERKERELEARQSNAEGDSMASF